MLLQWTQRYKTNNMAITWNHVSTQGSVRGTLAIFSSPGLQFQILQVLSIFMTTFKSSSGEEHWLWSLKSPILHLPSLWVLQALGHSDFSALLRELLPLMKPSGGEDYTSQGSRFREDECGPDELILLLVYLYSLADEAQPSDQDTEEEELEKLERELMGALTLVITQEQHLSPLLQKVTGERVNTATADSWLLPGVCWVWKWNRRVVKADC